jgi:tetratricopeptide (TPR) repeat protein
VWLLALAVRASAGCLPGQLDPGLDALIEARQDAAAQRLIAERLARDPADHVALYYRAIIPLLRGEADRFDEAIRHLEQCVALQPTVSSYRLWLGRAYGLQAQHGGIFTALGHVRGVHREFVEALRLDPRNHDARHDLLLFYLRAPRIVGGNVHKARSLAADCEPLDADMARVLRAMILVEAKECEAAWREAAAIGTPTDERVSEYARTLLRDLAACARRLGLAELAAQADAEIRRRNAMAPEAN